MVSTVFAVLSHKVPRVQSFVKVGGSAPVQHRVGATGQGSGTKPPKAENLAAFGCPKETANSSHSLYFENRRIKLKK